MNRERRYNIIGLIGFILSGLFFTAAAVKTGDVLTLAGSVIWIAACFLWLVPLLGKRD